MKRKSNFEFGCGRDRLDWTRVSETFVAELCRGCDVEVNVKGAQRDHEQSLKISEEHLTTGSKRKQVPSGDRSLRQKRTPSCKRPTALGGRRMEVSRGLQRVRSGRAEMLRFG